MSCVNYNLSYISETNNTPLGFTLSWDVTEAAYETSSDKPFIGNEIVPVEGGKISGLRRILLLLGSAPPVGLIPVTAVV